MAHEWNIRPRGRSCAVCGREFEDKQDCVSALFSAESGFERRDYCAQCWKIREDGGEPFSQWQGAFIPPRDQGARKEDAIKHETAESLLRKLVALDDPANTSVVYILAVMLERKKQLIERDVKTLDDGSVVRVYEQKSSGDTFVIRDPQLRLDAISGVQEQIVQMLQ